MVLCGLKYAENGKAFALRRGIDLKGLVDFGCERAARYQEKRKDNNGACWPIINCRTMGEAKRLGAVFLAVVSGLISLI